MLSKERDGGLLIETARGDGEHELCVLVFACDKIPCVHVEEHACCRRASSFVAVREWMICDDVKAVRSGHRRQVVVKVVSTADSSSEKSRKPRAPPYRWIWVSWIASTSAIVRNNVGMPLLREFAERVVVALDRPREGPLEDRLAVFTTRGRDDHACLGERDLDRCLLVNPMGLERFSIENKNQIVAVSAEIVNHRDHHS